MKILIDNGHGCDTPGKCSPDRSLLEYAYTRMIARYVVSGLCARGRDAELLVPEENDVPLAERCRRANQECGRLGADNVLVVSIHVNAAGNGQWMQARGWSAFTTKGRTKSDALADCLYNEAERRFAGLKIRRDMSDGDADWEENFYILRKTKCAAVLTENFFQDNHEDVAYLKSKEGIVAITQTHIDGIINYITQLTAKS